ncbi:porin family protein [uncultured Mucilaginibacter sp.]|uniref:porin family protein n=1 Tax=uncultured Mucilaginibacter sp. TaxID=797541 RepID=UPI0025EE741F|nr:porin family protein [uncultured Mucilaginibacter sp.]
MKKLILAAFLAGSFFTASAQSNTTFGVSGGVNFAKITASVDGVSGSGSSGTLTSFSVGVFADAPIGNNFSIQPGLYYTGKGGASDDGGDGKLKLSYLQVPINFLYNAPFGGGKLFVGAGPYVGIGLNAKTTNGRQSVDLEFGTDVKRTDVGATGLLGVRFDNGLLLKANYDLGLTNILGDNEIGVSSKNRVIGLSVGFTF